MRISDIVQFGVFSLTLAVPLEKKADYAVKDAHVAPEQWNKIHKPHPGQTLTLRIGLAQSNFEELERHLYEVSDPDHQRYGQHLSHEEIHALVTPSQQALGSVRNWLEESNIRLDQIEYSPAKDWLILSLPVSQVEDLLDTEYHIYENPTGDRIVRTLQYSLPVHLHEHVDVIQPTNYFSDTKALRHSPFKFIQDDLSPPPPITAKMNLAASSGNVAAVCNESRVTSLCLRTLYSTVDYVPKVPQKNYVATTNYLDVSANYSDFHIFMNRYRPDSNPKYQYSYQTIAGGVNDQSAESEGNDIEGNLDVQTVGGIVYPTRFTTYSTGGSPPFKPDVGEPDNENEPYLTWVDYVLRQKDVPYVVSTSYGESEQTVPRSYAKRVCQEFAQLGARGVTLLFASGDAGVGVNDTCISNDGTNTYKFLSDFPDVCPYVTSVGATRGFNPERVALEDDGSYVSGGGFSEYFPRPSYQDAAVKSYLARIGDLHKGLYNPKGRAYPDIAAQGYRFEIIYGGKAIRVDGMSASTPAAAGVLTLVNDALLAAGKPPLGFLNPWLYKNAGKGFNDVTIGNIFGCDTSGFPAAKGWDSASGFGTPDFKKIRDAVVGDGKWQGGSGGWGGYDWTQVHEN